MWGTTSGPPPFADYGGDRRATKRTRQAGSLSHLENCYQPDRLNPPRPEDDLPDEERREDDDLRPEPKSGKPLGTIIDPPPIVRFLRRRRCSA